MSLFPFRRPASRFTRGLAVILLGVLGSGCQTTAPPGPSSEAGRLPEYHLSPSDVVQIRVFEEPEFDTTARIGADGAITLPLAGPVAIAGNSIGQAGAILRDALKKFLVNPKVSLTVTEYAQRRFTILGEVKNPGLLNFPDNNPLTLPEAIGLAGGFTAVANSSRVHIKRRENGRPTVFVANALRMGTDEKFIPIEIHPGDVITVSESLF